MNIMLKNAGLALLVAMPFSAQAAIMELDGDGSYNGTVDGANSWLTDNAAADGVDFWTFETSAPGSLSVDISSDIDFGISVYAGAIMDEFETLFFDNDGDFGLLAYVEGNPSLFPMPGSSLSDVELAAPGAFTIAVGGDSQQQSGMFDYTMNVATQFVSASVPEPSSLALLLGGGVGLWARRQTRKTH